MNLHNILKVFQEMPHDFFIVIVKWAVETMSILHSEKRLFVNDDSVFILNSTNMAF